MMMLLSSAPLLLLLACTAAADRPAPSAYLPPRSCPPPALVTRYTTSYVTRTVVQPVVQTEVRVQTQQVVSTRVVPSEVVKTAVSDVATYQYRTVVVTQTRNSYSTQVVSVPGQTRYVDKPVQTAVEKVVQKEVVNTAQTTLVQPTTLYRTKTETRYSVKTQYVPQYTTVYSKVYGPGPVQYVTRTKVEVQTKVQQQQAAPVYLQKYQTVYSTVVRTVTVPGQVVTKTQNVYQTKEVLKTQVQYQTQVIAQTVQQQVPREVYATRTQYATAVVTQARYSTKVVPQYYTQTKVVTAPRVVTVTNTQVITQQVPVYPVTKNVQSTGIVVSTVGGGYRDQTVYQTVVQKQVVPVTSTRVVPQYRTRYVTHTEPCQYAPQRPRSHYRRY